MTTLLITGATGTIGRRLVHTLAGHGLRPAVLLRHPDRSAALGADRDHVIPLSADLDDAASLDAALHRVDRVFLVSPNGPQQVRHETALIDAAARAGVSRMVKVSAHGAHADSPVSFWRDHAAVEDHLARSGMQSVALRPMFSMANVLNHADGVRSHDVVVAPAVRTPVAMVDPQDVADVAARLLTSDALPAGASSLDVSGPVGITFDDLADTLSRLTGREITYRPITDHESLAYLEQRGTPPFVSEQILTIFAALRSGAQSHPVATVDHVLDRPPTTLAAFLNRQLDAFLHAS